MRNRSIALGSALMMVSALSLSSVNAFAAVKHPAKRVVLTVATVNNSQMVQMEQLTRKVFEKQNPNIVVKFVTLPENELRPKVTEDVATNAGKFDVVTIGNYEAPIWARNGWISNIGSQLRRLPAGVRKAYDYADLIRPIMNSLSYHQSAYALPFYGESSMLMYNKTMFAAHHLKMPLHPTWAQVAKLAKTLNNPKQGVSGIVMRGLAGWGMNLAPLDTVINTFGGEWFNMRWKPQMTSPATERAVTFYVDLLRKYGEPSAATTGFQQATSLMAQGKAGMFYDATSLAGVLETPSTSKIAGHVGFAYAPTAATAHGSHWLWSWALAMVKDSRHKAAALKWMMWATSPHYLVLAGKTFGWENVPPGTRYSIYHNPQYLKAAPFAKVTLNSIDTATPLHPTLHPVPYTGVQFVEIPQFETAGQEVSQDVSAAIAGTMGVKQALQEANSQLAAQVTPKSVKGY